MHPSLPVRAKEREGGSTGIVSIVRIQRVKSQTLYSCFQEWTAAPFIMRSHAAEAIDLLVCAETSQFM